MKRKWTTAGAVLLAITAIAAVILGSGQANPFRRAYIEVGTQIDSPVYKQDGVTYDLSNIGVGSGNEFTDSVFRIKDNTDDTKKIAFEASAIATGTERTITMPDADVDLGDIGSGSGGHTIEDDGTPVTAREALNFAGNAVALSDDAGNDATVVTITDTDTQLSDAEVATAYGNEVAAASQVEMETGTESAIRRMSPLRVAQAIAELAPEGGTVGDGTITNAKLADMAEATMKGRAAGAGTGVPSDLTASQIRTLINVADGAEANAVDSVNGATGVVVLDPDDLDDAATAHRFTSADEISKLSGIETGATADQSDSEIETAYNNQVGIVSQGDAETGTSTTAERWTPERVKQAIAALESVSTVQGQTGTVSLGPDDLDDAATTHKFASSAQLAKVDYLTITQAVDADALETAVAANTAKVTNATHTGQVTGATSLTLDKTAITGQTDTAPATGDSVVFSDVSDSGNLKEGTVAQILALITGLTDAQVSNTLTASIFVGSGSSTNAVDVGTAEIAGTLPVGNGGTGAATLGDAGVLVGNGTGAVQVTSAGTANHVLTSNGAGVDPTFQAAPGTLRVGTTTSSATPTFSVDPRTGVHMYILTAQAADITSMSSGLSGTPTSGQKLWIAITGTAARAITWGASFEAGAVALPTSTVTTQRIDIGFVWNATSSKWRAMAAGPLE